jgi:hypothetical protein
VPAFQPSGSRYRTTLRAESVSRSVRETLDSTSFPGRVAAVYDRACTLAFPDGSLVSLVSPEIGDGPLNIVVALRTLAALQPGQEVRLEDQWLGIGELAVSLERAMIWEPCPDWERLRKSCETIMGHLAHLESLALHLAPNDSLLVLVETDPGRGRPASASCRPADSFHLAPGRATVDESLHSVTLEAALSLRAGLKGDRAQLQAGVEQLAGLGGGLTPAGDDFLAGIMLWTWLARPDPRSWCRAMLEAATSRTTTLSAAFLRTAAAGECPASWHRLLVVLESGETQHLAAAVEGVLSYGHTSGADMLAGFLWPGADL